MRVDIYDFEGLKKQIHRQKKHAFDLENDIPWHLGIDMSKIFLPLDHEAIAFPGASIEQRQALSQWLGLIVNSTISEMEEALPNLREHGFEKILRNYPVNPEIKELGNLFFEEEMKHSRAFSRYLTCFCEEQKIEPHLIKSLLPKAYGSFFQNAITGNALFGGHAFWWVVATVEEVSIAIFHAMRRHRHEIDPLYYQLHKKHMEEEARHANFAYLILAMIEEGPQNIRQKFFKKTDFIFSHLVSKPWVLTELSKFYKMKDIAHKHPLFETLASCIPFLEKMTTIEVAQRFFLTAPYISWILNPKWSKKVNTRRSEYKALSMPFIDLKDKESAL